MSVTSIDNQSLKSSPLHKQGKFWKAKLENAPEYDQWEKLHWETQYTVKKTADGYTRRGKTFWVNKLTGESTWTMPPALEAHQDLRQGRACPGAHPRPPGFRRQNLDAHPPGPSKKTKRTPTRPLGKCLSNTPTHPAQRKKAKNGPGRPVPAWKKPGYPIPVGLELRPVDQKPPRLPLNH